MTMASRADRGLGYEKLVVGSDSQFALKHAPEKYTDFKIRNIYANAHLWSWTRSGAVGSTLIQKDTIFGVASDNDK